MFNQRFLKTIKNRRLKNNQPPKDTGFTLIELIVYAAAFVMLVAVLTLFIFNFIKVQAKIRIMKEVLDNSERAMEIMLFEIKHAQNVYTPTSVFNSHPGQLSLETKRNAPTDEETTYLDFYLDNNRLAVKREGAAPEALTSANVKINNLVFRHLTTAGVKAVRIELSAVYNGPAPNAYYQATSTLISSAILRND